MPLVWRMPPSTLKTWSDLGACQRRTLEEQGKTSSQSTPEYLMQTTNASLTFCLFDFLWQLSLSQYAWCCRGLARGCSLCLHANLAAHAARSRASALARTMRRIDPCHRQVSKAAKVPPSAIMGPQARRTSRSRGSPEIPSRVRAGRKSGFLTMGLSSHVCRFDVRAIFVLSDNLTEKLRA